MAGGIRISKTQSWTAAGWVFRHVLRQTIPLLQPTNERLIAELSDALLEGHLEFVDLSDGSDDEKRAFLAALQQGFAKTQTEGSESFAEPTFYPGFIARFKELIDLVSTDAKN
jgi:hypothetical protein